VSEAGAHALSSAVRGRAVLRTLGDVLVVAAGLLALPPAFALVSGEARLCLPFATPAAALAAAGLALRRLPRPSALQTNEALVVTAAAFVITPLSAAAAFASAGMAPADAVFEAISGVTTTGLTMLVEPERAPRTLLFARAWMQWYGGLGFVVFSLALVIGPGIAARRLGVGGEIHDLATTTRAHARRMLRVYVALTLAGVALLLALGAPAFDAVVYTFAAVSTGGFAPHAGSLASLDGALPAAVTAICVAGAVSMPLYAAAWARGPRVLLGDPELRALLALGLLAGAGLGLLWSAGSGPALRHAPIMAFAAQTTTGFSSVTVADLDAASKLVLVLCMAIGGSAGSTAGGVKLLRFLVALRILQWMLVRTRLPVRAVVEPRLAGERLDADEAQRALVVIGLFTASALLSWLPFLALGQPPIDALVEVVSALGTVGLSAGVTRHELPGVLKAVLCADMLLGRLEFVALLVAVSPRTWIGRRVG
jgi:trk system potassium uptake protein TrkH